MDNFEASFITTELTDIPKLDTLNLMQYAFEKKKGFIEDHIRMLENIGYRVSYQIIPFEINSYEDSCQLLIMFNFWK